MPMRFAAQCNLALQHGRSAKCACRLDDEPHAFPALEYRAQEAVVGYGRHLSAATL